MDNLHVALGEVAPRQLEVLSTGVDSRSRRVSTNVTCFDDATSIGSVPNTHPERAESRAPQARAQMRALESRPGACPLRTSS